jgi:hypothetical protein
VQLDEKPAVVADAIYVDIHGEALSRTATPPGNIGADQEMVVPLAINVVNEVLGRFRALGENSPVVEIAEDVPHVLIYLDDSGKEFESDSSGQSVRRRMKARITVPSLLLLTPDLWSAGRDFASGFH